MPQLSAYLSFDGNCAEAMRFYERVLGGRLDALVRYADAPADAAMPVLSDEDAGRVMYARLTLDEQTLLASDATAGHPYPGKQGVALALVYPTVSDAHRVFEDADGILQTACALVAPSQRQAHARVIRNEFQAASQRIYGIAVAAQFPQRLAEQITSSRVAMHELTAPLQGAQGMPGQAQLEVSLGLDARTMQLHP